MPGGRKGRESWPTSDDDRRQFVRENAVQLLAERDTLIERLREEVTRLHKTVREIRRHNAKLARRLANKAGDLLAMERPARNGDGLWGDTR